MTSREERTYDNVKRFWNEEASQKGQTPQVTVRDHFFRLHELQVLISLIPFNCSVLDVGCGTGFSSLIISTKAAQVTAIDYSEEMIRWARLLIGDAEYREDLLSKFGYQFRSVQPGHVEFLMRDLLQPLKLGRFDIITGQRILINIATPDEQLMVLRRLREHTQANSKMVLVEVTMQGHDYTNQVRSEFHIPPLEKYWRNCNIDEDSLNRWESFGWKIKEVLTFDTYMLLSKVIYPAAIGQEFCKFMSGANQAAMEVANLFRTREAVDEIGLKNMLELYLSKVRDYDETEHAKLSDWIVKNSCALERLQWDGLGHVKLFLCAPS